MTTNFPLYIYPLHLLDTSHTKLTILLQAQAKFRQLHVTVVIFTHPSILLLSTAVLFLYFIMRTATSL
jgi:hypothetical protein